MPARGYAVYLLLDASLEDIKRGVRMLQCRLSQGDTVVVHYSGHGMQYEGKNFLIPVDADLSSAAGRHCTTAASVHMCAYCVGVHAVCGCAVVCVCAHALLA